MARDLVLWGASGHAKVLRECMRAAGFEVVAVFDNEASVIPPFADVPLFIGEAGFLQWRATHTGDDVAALVAIGGSRGEDRLRIQDLFASHGLQVERAIHAAAFVAGDAVIGAGSQVLAHATVGVEAVVGAACIVNTAASVDHECVLGDGVHIAPGATLAGCVEIGRGTLIGPGAVILPRVRVGEHAIVGAGAVVTRDLPDGVVAFGVPARVQRRTRKA